MTGPTRRDYYCAMPDLTVPVPGPTELPAYLARPSVGFGPWPGVVLIHDAVGMTSVTREHADRLATAGYLTLAPDLYSRGGLIKCLVSTLSAVASGQGQAYDVTCQVIPPPMFKEFPIAG